MELRISTLQNDATRLTGALPEYTTKNFAALNDAIRQSQGQANSVTADRDTFSAALAPQLASSKQAIDNFVSSPFDLAAADALIKSGGGSDLSLPEITIDKWVVDIPSVTGITASQRLFGSTVLPELRRIEREEAKAQLELAGDSSARSLAEQELSLAKAFGEQTGARATEIATALTQDAKSIRYAKGGQLRSASYSSVSGGEIDQGDLAPDSVPPVDSILARGEVFQRSAAILSQQITQVGNSLTPDDPNLVPRKALLEEATVL